MAPSVAAECRAEVHARDQGCVARLVDPDAGPCYNAWGEVISTPWYIPFDVGEMDYVRLRAAGPRHVLPGDHVWLCPGHHRGTGPSAGYQWATANRDKERAYLDAQDGIVRLGEGEMSVDDEPVGTVREATLRLDR